MKKPKKSSFWWRIKFILYPFSPFIIEFFFHWLIRGRMFQIDLINTVTLIISVGILCFFVSHNLIINSYEFQQDQLRKDDYNRVQGLISLFQVYTMVSISLFTALIIFQALSIHRSYEYHEILTVLNVLVCIFAVPVIFTALSTQRSFKLSAR